MSEVVTDAAPSLKCAGCRKKIDPLTTHLTVTVKARKFAFFTPAPDPENAPDPEQAQEFEADDAQRPQLGTRTGVGEELVFHNTKCMADHFDEKEEKAPQLRLNNDDSDPYNEGREGSDG